MATRRIFTVFAWVAIVFVPSLGAAQSSTSNETTTGTALSSSDQANGEPQEITFDYLTFEMEKGGHFERTMLTDKIRELDGKKIRLRGFIRPAFKQTGIKNFIFVRDNQACCFGPGAALYDCILVSLQTDKTTDFTVRPITVEGEFFLKEYNGPDGNVWAVFNMRNAIAH